MSRSTMLAVALIAVLGLGACSRQEPEISLEDQVPAEQREAAAEDGEGGEDGGDGENAGGGDESVYEAFDLGLEGPTELAAGDVTITIDNTGNLPHDITIEELGDETVVEAEGGESDSATVTLEAGSYTFYCSVPGHRSAMELAVEVTE